MFVKWILPWVIVVIPAAYFIFLIVTWNSYLRFQLSVRKQVDEKLDEWLARQPNAD